MRKKLPFKECPDALFQEVKIRLQDLNLPEQTFHLYCGEAYKHVSHVAEVCGPFWHLLRPEDKIDFSHPERSFHKLVFSRVDKEMPRETEEMAYELAAMTVFKHIAVMFGNIFNAMIGTLRRTTLVPA